MKFIKKIVATTIAAGIFVSSFTISLADESFLIHEDVTKEKLASGLFHERIQKFTSEGFTNINVLRVDLDDKYTDIAPMFNESSIYKKETVSTMVNDSKAIAGINGDFFSTYHVSSPLGTMVKDGKLITNPTNPKFNKLPVLSFDEEKVPLINYWQWSIEAVCEDKEPITVYSINKDSKLNGEVRMYDKNWGEKTLGNTFFNDLCEIIINDGEVIDIRVGKESIDMPENGFILTGRDNAKKLLLDTFSIGDEVKLNISTTPDYKDLKSAIGGGTVLVKDGLVSDFNLNIKGNHPRTAVGFTKDKKELIMVTIDGRDESFKGVTQEELAEIMIDLGAYNAINLDGGGSTTMALNPRDKKHPIVVNKPSDGSERRVSNGLGIFNNAPERRLDNIKIITDDTNVFVNTSRSFKIKGYDKYQNPVHIEQDKVNYYVKNLDGDFDDNIFKPKKTGTATVIAKYDGEEAKIDINVLDEVKDIVLDTNEFSISANTENHITDILGTIVGVNEKGYRVKLNPRDIDWTIHGDIGEFDGDIFESSKNPSSGALTLKVGNGVENVLASIGFNKVDLLDFEDIKNMEFRSWPKVVTGSIEKENEDKEDKYSVKLNYDFTTTDDTRVAHVNIENENIVLNNETDKLGMWVYGDNSNHWLRGELLDSEGKIHRINFAGNIDWDDWKWVTADIPSNISYPVKVRSLYLAEINPLVKDTGSIYLDGLKALYKVPIKSMVLPKETVIKDNLEKHVELKDGYRFIVTKGVNDLENLMEYQLGRNIINTLENVDLGFFLNGMNEKFLEVTETKTLDISEGFSNFNHKDISFIKLDNTNKGIRATNAEQWPAFMNALKGSENKNIILLLPKDIFETEGFSDPLERELFHETLTKYSRDKNIFVIHGGNENKVILKDGIRYMEFNNTDINPSKFKETNYTQFTIVDGKITYETLPLFKE
ncbi:MAG: phosphodiester glycosidase family protein [Firmicutes bacterium]|nr:phosphodiester glycosidase family protein [Bacillota bacterium]